MFSYLFGILVLFVSIRVHMFQRARSHTHTERIYNKWIGSLIYYSYELKAYPAARNEKHSSIELNTQTASMTMARYWAEPQKDTRKFVRMTPVRKFLHLLGRFGPQSRKFCIHWIRLTLFQHVAERKWNCSWTKNATTLFGALNCKKMEIFVSLSWFLSWSNEYELGSFALQIQMRKLMAKHSIGFLNGKIFPFNLILTLISSSDALVCIFILFRFVLDKIHLIGWKLWNCGQQYYVLARFLPLYH